jgi:uncharacterized OsmC-like protein
MSNSPEIRLTLEQESDYAFRIEFNEVSLAPLMTDEPAPLGQGQGPNPSGLLLASIANCLAASFVFALRKYKNNTQGLRATIVAHKERNAEGRWRIPRASVTLQLAESQAELQQLDRIVEQFEQFCIVTQSVREGIEVDVTIQDSQGQLLKGAAVKPV